MEKKRISAEVIADSVNQFGHRITSLVCTFPRFILAELNTHRVFSRNSASSRAVPFKKMVEMVENDPFIPIAWQIDHPGMQGTQYLTDKKYIDFKTGVWLISREAAIIRAKELNGHIYRHEVGVEEALVVPDTNVTKQLANRLLEPFMWHICIITATDWENFFNLRCPQYGSDEQGYYKSKKDALRGLQSKGVDISNLINSTDLEWLKVNKGAAEIHMMALAECIYDAINESTPKELGEAGWHIPFGDNIDVDRVKEETYCGAGTLTSIQQNVIKIATARCARVSYINYEGKDDYAADIALFDRLSKSRNTGVFHASPFEHCAMAMSGADLGGYYVVEGGKQAMGQCRNFQGWIQLRVLMEK